MIAEVFGIMSYIIIGMLFGFLFGIIYAKYKNHKH